MTTKEFFQAPLFEEAAEFFAEATHPAPEASERLRSTALVTSVSGKILRSAAAVLSLGLMPISRPTVNGSLPRLELTGTQEAGAAVEVPRMSPSQVRGARLLQGLFEAVSEADDAEGEDPDYGF